MFVDATRIRIILALRDQELAVNQLAETVNKPHQNDLASWGSIP